MNHKGKKKNRKKGRNHKKVKEDSKMKKMKFDFNVHRWNSRGVEMK